MKKITFLIVSLLVFQGVFSQLKMRTAKNCNCKFNTNATFTWNGACKNGYCHGYGIIQWYDQSGKKSGKIVGSVKNGMSEGFCTMYYSDGSKSFEGNYVNDKRNGHGIVYYSDGSKYEGEWKADMKNGIGTFTDSNGVVGTPVEYIDDVELESSSIPVSNSDAQSEDNLKEILEGFCQNYYSSCFSGRKYVENSLTVSEVEYRENSVVKVTGSHSYRGSYNSLYEYMDYYVYITMGSNQSTIEFHKRAKADFFNPSDYWEECSKTINY